LAGSILSFLIFKTGNLQQSPGLQRIASRKDARHDGFKMIRNEDISRGKARLAFPSHDYYFHAVTKRVNKS
jgi:hypothetical protein